MRSRLAPTPSGMLHEGNALNFILTWWFTRFHRGELILRIDDSDDSRSRDAYLQDIFEVIDWLGIDYDHGPFNIEEHKRNFSQALKKEYYFNELNSFLEGKLFGCSCSRRELKDHDNYPGTCSHSGLSFIEGETCLRSQRQQPGEFNQMVLWRKDDKPAYQLVSVLEDRDSRITDIIRGEDLFNSSVYQRELFSDFGESAFPKTFHHEVILGENHLKLSKGQADQGVREKFSNKENFFKNILWPFLGKKFEGVSLEELKRTPPDPSIFKEAF